MKNDTHPSLSPRSIRPTPYRQCINVTLTGAHRPTAPTPYSTKSINSSTCKGYICTSTSLSSQHHLQPPTVVLTRTTFAGTATSNSSSTIWHQRLLVQQQYLPPQGVKVPTTNVTTSSTTTTPSPSLNRIQDSPLGSIHCQKQSIRKNYHFSDRDGKHCQP